MPRVNVRYELKLDATVSLYRLKFGNKPIKPTDTNGQNYAGTVKDVMCDDKHLQEKREVGCHNFSPAEN